MNIRKKLMQDKQGLLENGPINIVILGDSVSHGSFNGYIDYESVYWNLLRKRLNALRDYVPINMICAAIGGTTAKEALARLERDVLTHAPDLVIVCFGLNDVNGTLEEYLQSLKTIFERVRATGSDLIFLTPNMLNTYVAEGTPKQYFDYAHVTARMQNDGKMDTYIYKAVEMCKEMGVLVCDCYSEWKELSKTKDTTLLLSNRINHPTEEMHRLFTDRLYTMIVGEDVEVAESDSTMHEN